MSTMDYKSENAEVDYLSFLEPKEGEALIGKTIAKVIAQEYDFELIFTDGTKLRVSGCSYGDSGLLGEYEQQPKS